MTIDTSVDRYAPGVPCWIELVQPDPAAAADFYSALFGWRVAEADDGLVARRDGLEVAGFRAGDGGAWTTAVRVSSATAAAAAVVRAGGRVVDGPARVGRAGCAVDVVDPTGAPLRLWEAGERRGAQAVNQDGTWNWSNLHTPDPAVAEAFYGTLFGWETLPLGPTSMWVLPGYREVLERFDPTLRGRHATDGVPAGFSDAVGWLIPGSPARWAVTFAADDTDAVVALARSLGAVVTVEPYDAPFVRAAELVDPFGAAFAVNTYRPG